MMGKQSRQRKQRRNGPIITKDVHKVLGLCRVSFDAYMDIHQHGITNYEEQLAVILDWVSLHPNHNGVQKFAAAIVLRDLNDNQLRYTRGELFRHVFTPGTSLRGNAAVRILQELPVPKDSSDLLEPLSDLPTTRNPRRDYELYVLNEMLRLRPPAYWPVVFISALFYCKDQNQTKDGINSTFYPLRVLIDSPQGEKVLKLLDATAWSADPADQAHIARFLRWIPYDIYLRSPHWQRVRSSALDRANHRCQVCNSPHLLNVHHRTYERRGQELPEDLTVLCKTCHETFHKTGRLAKEVA